MEHADHGAVAAYRRREVENGHAARGLSPQRADPRPTLQSRLEPWFAPRPAAGGGGAVSRHQVAGASAQLDRQVLRRALAEGREGPVRGRRRSGAGRRGSDLGVGGQLRERLLLLAEGLAHLSGDALRQVAQDLLVPHHERAAEQTVGQEGSQEQRHEGDGEHRSAELDRHTDARRSGRAGGAG